MNITLTIDAPELARALNNLANAMGATGNPLPAITPVAEKEEKATKTMYLRHEPTDELLVVKKGESLEFMYADNFDILTKAEYDKLNSGVTNTKPEPVKEELKDPEATNEKPATEPEVTGITLEAVRGKLADFSAGGKANQMKVKEALTELGVKKLTDVDPADYANLLEAVGLSA